jgi:hypothetical protein
MADDTSDTTGTTLTLTPEATVTATVEEPELGDAGKKAIAEERKAKKDAEKRAAELEAQLKQYQDRDKTEAEKLAERATAAEAAAAGAQREIARLRVIAEVQLDPDLHEFVIGDTEDEMRARAEKLKAKVTGSVAPEPTTEPGPRPDLSQGARSAMPLNGDPLTQSVKNVLGIR